MYVCMYVWHYKFIIATCRHNEIIFVCLMPQMKSFPNANKLMQQLFCVIFKRSFQFLYLLKGVKYLHFYMLKET